MALSTMKITLLSAALILATGAIYMAGVAGLNMSQATITPSGVQSSAAGSFANKPSAQPAVVAESNTPKMLAPADFVKQQVATQDVIVFSKSYCPYCKRTKALFQDLNVNAHVVELDLRDDGGEIQAELAKLTGQRTVPNVFIKGTHVGGSDATHAANNNGRLQSLLNGARVQ